MRDHPNPAGVKFFSTKWLQPQIVFLAIGVTFGLALLAANPPFQAPDENDHYYRAYQFSEGTWVGEKRGGSAGGELPVPIARGTEMGDIPFHSDKKMTAEIFRRKSTPAFVDLAAAPRVFVNFPHTVVYAPHGYVLQSTIMALGRLAHVGPLGLMYLARLAVLAASLWLGYAALRALPAFRWSCLLLLLAPMSLYLMGSVAPDGVLISSAFLLAGLLLGPLQTERGAGAPSLKMQALLVGLATVLAVSKVVYLPLALLVPWAVLPRLRDRRARFWFLGVFGAVCLLPLWGWSRIIAAVYVPGRADIRLDPALQAHYMLSEPWGFVRLMLNSFWDQSDGIYRWFVGTLGWGDTPMPDWFYTAYGWSVFACCLAESAGARVIAWRQRGVLLSAALITVVLIVAAQYASWNAPGSRASIEGLSGRYFLPVSVLAILSFPPLGRLRAPEFWGPLIGGGGALVGAVVALKAVILRFYFP